MNRIASELIKISELITAAPKFNVDRAYKEFMKRNKSYDPDKFLKFSWKAKSVQLLKEKLKEAERVLDFSVVDDGFKKPMTQLLNKTGGLFKPRSRDSRSVRMTLLEELTKLEMANQFSDEADKESRKSLKWFDSFVEESEDLYKDIENDVKYFQPELEAEQEIHMELRGKRKLIDNSNKFGRKCEALKKKGGYFSSQEEADEFAKILNTGDSAKFRDSKIDGQINTNEYVSGDDDEYGTETTYDCYFFDSKGLFKYHEFEHVVSYDKTRDDVDRMYDNMSPRHRDMNEGLQDEDRNRTVNTYFNNKWVRK